MAQHLMDIVRAHTNPLCEVAECSDSGCSLSLRDVPSPYIVLNLEHSEAPQSETGRHCDFLFLGGSERDEGPWIALIELTTGTKRLSDLLGQLSGGADIAEALIPRGRRVRLKPIFAHRGSGLHRRDWKKLKDRTNRVTFRGQAVHVKVAKCGGSLASALAS